MGGFEDGLQEQLFLQKVGPLLAQDVAHGVVELHKLAQLVLPVHGQAELKSWSL